MPQTSSSVWQPLPSDHRFDNQRQDHSPALDANEHGSRIRARRTFSATTADVLAAWTSAAAWERWMRMRARSRATMAAYPGGAFRLEVAEGPAIHVMTGEVIDISEDHASFSWCHHDISERSSLITVTVRETENGTEMLFVHDHIASRREASWLMRFWATALGRLDDHQSRFLVEARRRRGVDVVSAADSARPRAQRATTFARSA